ncbi:capsid protein [Apilactobacillus xinyiensis]|uniref:capsid protein n=1 Tax=Apilactobacillus xinyiensis TaxID=2841032 RepID=UPI00200C1BEE|nr:capsid protein [Apilactobacillus xinyiensis]MCL0319377.1 capsid protein [Apilactobacillus xinyiensis]
MAVNYAEKYQSALVQAFADDQLRSADLWQSPSNNLVQFMEANVIKVPNLKILSGRTNRTRGEITTHSSENYENEWNPYNLAFDRQWSTLVDPMDVDETNMVVSIANITRTFNIYEKLPEMDRYMFSKLYKEKLKANDDGIHNDALDEKTILNAFDTMMMNMDEKRVPSENRLLYVTPQVNKMLKQAEARNRALSISGNGKVDRAIYSLDDVVIKVVPSDLMQSDFDFTVGTKLKDDAKQINMMLIQNGVQIAPQKYSFVGMDNPTASNDGNFNYYERSYADVFLLKGREAGVEMYVSDKPKNATPATK